MDGVEKFKFEKQIAAICKTSFFHIRQIARIRRFDESVKILVHAFVTCRLDNCNSLLYGLPKNLIQKLQRVQNCAARLIMKGRRYDHITPILIETSLVPGQRTHYF